MWFFLPLHSLQVLVESTLWRWDVWASQPTRCKEPQMRELKPSQTQTHKKFRIPNIYFIHPNWQESCWVQWYDYFSNPSKSEGRYHQRTDFATCPSWIDTRQYSQPSSYCCWCTIGIASGAECPIETKSTSSLHCALSLVLHCIVIGPVCMCVSLLAW